MSRSSSAPAGTVEIVVNGSGRQIRAGTSYAQMVTELAGEARMVAVERNGEILPRARWAETEIAAGDRIEIVRFVQGG